MSAAAIVLMAVAGYFVFDQFSSGGYGAESTVAKQEKQYAEPTSSSNQQLTDPDETYQGDESEQLDTDEENLESVQVERDGMAPVFDKKDRPSARRRSTVPQKAQQTRKFPAIVSGQVVDDVGEPLIGASIFFPNNEAGITTGFDGKFAVELRSNETSAIVNYTGYRAGNFSISTTPDQVFQLYPDEIVLNDVVVADQSPQKEEVETVAEEPSDWSNAASYGLPEAKRVEEQTTNAVPERGFKKYAKYIKRNLDYPAAAESNKIEGIVVIHFKVLPNGELFDFRIVQGLGYGCDEEAMRVIREGPAWESSSPDLIGEVTYEIEFEL